MNKKIITVIFLIVIALIAASGGFEYLNKMMGMKNDNKVEDFVEDVIEVVTGKEFELTP